MNPIKFLPLLTIVLVVSQQIPEGSWITARSYFSTMGQCKRAKIEVERGLKGDAVENYKVECRRT